MTYDEYKDHLKVCVYLGREPAGKFGKVYAHLTGLWDDLECVVGTRVNQIGLRKGEEWYFEQDFTNGWLWCNNDLVWSLFRDELRMELTEIKDFVKMVVGEHLKCDMEEPTYVVVQRPEGWKII